MKVFILFSLFICLTGCSVQKVKTVFRRHIRFAGILSEGK